MDLATEDFAQEASDLRRQLAEQDATELRRMLTDAQDALIQADVAMEERKRAGDELLQQEKEEHDQEIAQLSSALEQAERERDELRASSSTDTAQRAAEQEEERADFAQREAEHSKALCKILKLQKQIDCERVARQEAEAECDALSRTVKLQHMAAKALGCLHLMRHEQLKRQLRCEKGRHERDLSSVSTLPAQIQSLQRKHVEEISQLEELNRDLVNAQDRAAASAAAAHAAEQEIAAVRQAAAPLEAEVERLTQESRQLHEFNLELAEKMAAAQLRSKSCSARCDEALSARLVAHERLVRE